MAKNKKRKHLESKRRKFEDKSRRLDPKMDSQMTSSTNPFEFHRNKVKHNIIGRKLAKNEFGNKGLSRNRAFNKRKTTLLEEYKQKHKSGKGVQDLRSKDNQLITNWKERNQSIDKSLSETTLLTHKGKQLNDFIDDFVGSDDEDIDLFNRPEFIESTHFGGGSDGRPKSANEVLDQIMDEKREKQLERTANLELTEKLDSEWNSVKNILRHKGVKHELTNNTNEDFDILVKQLMFDNRSKPIISVQNVVQQKEVITNEKDVQTIEKSVETLFKEMIQSIQSQNNWPKILNLIKKSTNDLLPKISDQSINILVEKYQTIIETNITFSANNLGFLLIGTHIKETKLIVKLILTKMLDTIKLKSFKEIAIVLVIIKILLITSKAKYIPEIFNSILNIIRLTQTSKSIPNLNVEQNNEKSPDFSAKYIFDQTFDNSENQNQIKTILLKESLLIIEQIFDINSNILSFNELFSEIRNICSKLSDKCLNPDLKDLLSNLLTKLKREEPKVNINESRPKPFMLPMFEPKFDDKSNDIKNNSNKKLLKKYNREMKGAKRELRKDSNFLRKTWVNEIIDNDIKRKHKVKLIMGDLAQQQGLYKKKKKK